MCILLNYFSNIKGSYVKKKKSVIQGTSINVRPTMVCAASVWNTHLSNIHENTWRLRHLYSVQMYKLPWDTSTSLKSWISQTLKVQSNKINMTTTYKIFKGYFKNRSIKTDFFNVRTVTQMQIPCDPWGRRRVILLTL